MTNVLEPLSIDILDVIKLDYLRLLEHLSTNHGKYLKSKVFITAPQRRGL
jgi:hypothetical protein